MKSIPRLAVGFPSAPRIRFQHRRGEVLGYTVEHHFDRRRPEAAHRTAIPATQEFFDLFLAGGPLPPESPYHPGGQFISLRQRTIGLFGLRGDVGVLPGSYPERQKVILRNREASFEIRHRIGRNHSMHQPHRSLLEGSGRCSVACAFDAAVGWVRGGGNNPGLFQRPAIHPGAVTVTVDQENRPVGNDTIEILAGRRASREGIHGPSCTKNPRLVRVLIGIGSDGLQV